MKRGKLIIMLCAAPILLGCGHDPNHGIDMDQARAAANRVHRPPTPDDLAKMGPDHGG